MLRVEQLRLAFQSGRQTLVAVDGVSFDIAAGETFALLALIFPPERTHEFIVLFFGCWNQDCTYLTTADF